MNRNAIKKVKVFFAGEVNNLLQCAVHRFFRIYLNIIASYCNIDNIKTLIIQTVFLDFNFSKHASVIHVAKTHHNVAEIKMQNVRIRPYIVS